MQNQQHQLAAILFTDIVGYTAMMQEDERKAINIVKHYIDTLQITVAEHSGKILNDYGDGSLCVFSSATQAVQCAVEIQKKLQTGPTVPLRIGLHIGEIFFEGEKVLGDSVNVASRIQSLGQANTILFSKEIFDKIKNKSEFSAISVGTFEFKNVTDPVEVFALTNEGLVIPKKNETSGKLKEIQKKSVLKKWMIAAVVVALIAISFFIYKATRPTGFSGSEKSIAVLPFENIGSDKSEDYISDGITQDIINNLSKISSLQKVIGWISVKSFKKTNKTVKDIAGELDVAAILSGTIQKQGEKTHIIAELTEVGTSKRLWGDDFEYSGSDLLSIQSKVAIEIVNALKANLTPEEKKGLSKNYTDNVEAYKLYRRGRSFWEQRSKASYDSAEAYYKKAIDVDPDYALAYAGLADCYTFNQKGLLQTEAIPIARDYANRALKIDSSLIEARTTIAFIQSHFDFDFKGSVILFKKIISEDPNYVDAHIYYGNVLIGKGNIEEGLSEEKKALSLDPLSVRSNFVLGRNYYYSRRYDSAISQLQKALILNPKFINAFVPMGQSYLQKKLYPNAIEAFSKLPAKLYDVENNGLLMLCYSYALEGDDAKAKNLFEKVSQEDRLKSPCYTAYVYISMGDFANALTLLEYAYNAHSLYMPVMKVDPALDPIRNETRFKELIKKMNLE